MTLRLLFLLTVLAAGALAQEEAGPQIADLEQRLEALERDQVNLMRKVDSESLTTESRLHRLEDDIEAVGIVLFLSGILCALWAQYTRRSAWFWFFFGLFLAPIALVAVVWKNALGLQAGTLRHWTKDA